MSLRVGAPENLILCLDGLAAMASGEQAARLIGLARATRARLALKLSVRDEELHARHATRVLEEIGAEAFAAAEAVGNGSTPEDALSGRLGYS